MSRSVRPRGCRSSFPTLVLALVVASTLVPAARAESPTLEFEYVTDYTLRGQARRHAEKRQVTLEFQEDNEHLALYLLEELLPDEDLRERLAEATGSAPGDLRITGRRVREQGAHGEVVDYTHDRITVRLPDGSTRVFGHDLVEPPSPILGRPWWVLVNAWVEGQAAGSMVWRTYETRAEAEEARDRVETPGEVPRLSLYFRRQIGAPADSLVNYQAEVREQTDDTITPSFEALHHATE